MVAINLQNAIKRRVGPHMIRTPTPPKGIQKPGGSGIQRPKPPNTGGKKTFPKPKGNVGGKAGVKKIPFTGTGHLYGANPPKGGVPYKKPLTALQQYLLGDSTYVSQLSQFNKAQADFLADQGLDRSEYLRGYTNTARDIGLAQTEGNKDIKDEYAGRGLLRSGIFNTAAADMGRKFLNQQTDLSNQKTGFMTRLQQEQLKFKNEQAIARQQAISDAARRRAEKLNL